MPPPSNDARHPDANRLLPEDRPVHDWYRFVLSYPPHLVRRYVERFALDRGSVVCDPFAGTGTTPVEAKKLGLCSTSIEANAMAHLACRVKLDWAVDSAAMLAESEAIAARVQERLARDGLAEGDLTAPEVAARQELLTLTSEQQEILSPGWISPLPLHRTLTLLTHLRAAPPRPWRDHQLLALARALPTEIGNLKFSPEVGPGEVKADAPVVAAWLGHLRTMAADLEGLGERRPGPVARVYRGDARAAFPAADRPIDAVITSPPYPNEKDYTRATRLESVVLGLLRSRADLRALKQGLLRSNSRNVYVADADDACVADLPRVQDLARRIEERRVALGKTSGFERAYARVTRLYFGGMHRHLAALAPALRPGARLAYVVGDQASFLRVLIRTGEVLAEIAERLGYEVEGLDLFRERYATASQAWLREEVLVLRWPGHRR